MNNKPYQQWSPIDLAMVTDLNLADCEDAYAIMDNEDWIEYCKTWFEKLQRAEQTQKGFEQ
ncbi:MAG: hypothetical protein Q8O83_02145 [bacterium]|nr:hypothetical protein [bacterium]